MALSLNLSVLEQNDSKALIFTDITGTSTGGWNNSGNIPVTDIDGVNYNLGLQLTFKSNDSTIVYDIIDLDALKGPFNTPSDMIYTITPDMLKIGGVSAFTTDSLIPDAVIDVVYSLTGSTPFTMTLFAYNQIRNKVYERLRNIPPVYMAYDSRSKEISDTLLMYSFLKSMEASAYVALEQELLNILDATEKIYINGSNYTWQ